MLSERVQAISRAACSPTSRCSRPWRCCTSPWQRSGQGPTCTTGRRRKDLRAQLAEGCRSAALLDNSGGCGRDPDDHTVSRPAGVHNRAAGAAHQHCIAHCVVLRPYPVWCLQHGAVGQQQLTIPGRTGAVHCSRLTALAMRCTGDAQRCGQAGRCWWTTRSVLPGVCAGT